MKLCFTNEARQSNIDRISELIDKLGHTTDESGISFIDYCTLCDYLEVAKKAYKEEMN